MNTQPLSSARAPGRTGGDPTLTPARRKDQLLSRNDVEALIAEGHSIFIVNQKVLKADAWLEFHPGGAISIQHLVGRDATAEINGYKNHIEFQLQNRFHSDYTKEQMLKFQIGRIQGHWKNFVPPIQGGKFRTRHDIEHCTSSDEDEPTKESCSTSETSRSPSPVFDSIETTVRRRMAEGSDLKRAPSSSSSLSSFSSTEIPIEKPTMSFLDAKTQKEIDLDLSIYPPLDSATQDEIIRKYRLLDQRIHEAGLYDCPYSSYLIEGIRYSLLFAGFLTFLRLGWYATSAVFLGLFWHQLVFTAHDAGHMGITHDFKTDTTIGILIADFLGGLSIGWWKRNHNVHHIVTNSPEHDPDIEHMPFFAISHRFLQSLFSTYYQRVMTYDWFAKIALRYQNYLYYPLLCFGRFNLYRLSWEYLLGPNAPRKGPAAWTRRLELLGQVFFWAWFGYGVVYKSVPTMWDRFVFVMISHMVTMPLHVQITLSHFAMSTADLGEHESFPQRMLRTTMDVDCPQWLDFIHGGLQFQAIHHLYPRIPRHNLRKTQKMVQEFCNDVKIPYALFGFVDGNKQVIGRLEDVGRQAAILAECQKALAEGKVAMH